MFSQETLTLKWHLTKTLTSAALTSLSMSKHIAMKSCVVGFWALLLFNKSTCCFEVQCLSKSVFSWCSTRMGLSQIKQNKAAGVTRFAKYDLIIGALNIRFSQKCVKLAIKHVCVRDAWLRKNARRLEGLYTLFQQIKKLLSYFLNSAYSRNSDYNWTRTHNHLVHKQTLNHLASLAKWWSFH